MECTVSADHSELQNVLENDVEKQQGEDRIKPEEKQVDVNSEDCEESDDASSAEITDLQLLRDMLERKKRLLSTNLAIPGIDERTSIPDAEVGSSCAGAQRYVIWRISLSRRRLLMRNRNSRNFLTCETTIRGLLLLTLMSPGRYGSRQRGQENDTIGMSFQMEPALW